MALILLSVICLLTWQLHPDSPQSLGAFKAQRDGCLQESLDEEMGSKDSGEWLGGGELEELEEGGKQLGSQEGSPRGWGV